MRKGRRVGLVALLALAASIATIQPSAVAAPNDQQCVGASRTFPAPPTDLDLLTATDAQLATYGFPPRPPTSTTQALAVWTDVISHAKYRDLDPDSSPCQTNVQHTTYSNNWSGYGVPSSPLVAGGFNEVENEWIVPQVASNPSYTECGASGSSNAPTVSVWGGIGVNDLIQAGTDSCSDATPRYRFWYEDYPLGSHYAGPSPHPGDTAYQDSHNNNGTCNFFLEDVTTGGYWPAQIDCPYQGKYQGDFITERIGVHYLPSFSPIWQGDNYSFAPSGGSWGLTSSNSEKYMMTSDCTSSGTKLAAPGSISSSTAFYNYHYADGPWNGC